MSVDVNLNLKTVNGENLVGAGDVSTASDIEVNSTEVKSGTAGCVFYEKADGTLGEVPMFKYDEQTEDLFYDSGGILFGIVTDLQTGVDKAAGIYTDTNAAIAYINQLSLRGTESCCVGFQENTALQITKDEDIELWATENVNIEAAENVNINADKFSLQTNQNGTTFLCSNSKMHQNAFGFTFSEIGRTKDAHYLNITQGEAQLSIDDDYITLHTQRGGIGFFNAYPQSQYEASNVAYLTTVIGSSDAITKDTTIGNYTMEQVVDALLKYGLLKKTEI